MMDGLNLLMQSLLTVSIQNKQMILRTPSCVCLYKVCWDCCALKTAEGVLQSGEDVGIVVTVGTSLPSGPRLENLRQETSYQL